MSTVFFACLGQPMSQRPRLVQPRCGTPLNGLRRSSPKWTASGSRSATRPARSPAAAKARPSGVGGSSGRRARLKRFLGAVVVRVERGSVDRSGPVAVEDGRRERAAARSRRPASRRRRRRRSAPPGRSSSAGRTARSGSAHGCHSANGACRDDREVAGPEAPTPLEHAHPQAGLGQPAGGDAAAETGADDHRVVRVLHIAERYTRP